MNDIDYSKLTPELKGKLAEWEKKKPENRQLQVMSDIAVMVQELIDVADDTKAKNSDALKALGAVLTDSREQLVELNKKEAPESPDYAKPVVDAVSKLETALTKAFAKIDVKPEFKPNIKVDAPNVNVEAPVVDVDLTAIEKILKTDIPKAFEKAIKLIPQPEEHEDKDYTDKFNEMVDWLKSIDTASRLKPVFPTQLKVVNPDGTNIGTLTPGRDFDLLTVTNTGATTDELELTLAAAPVQTITITYATAAIPKVSDDIASVGFA